MSYFASAACVLASSLVVGSLGRRPYFKSLQKGMFAEFVVRNSANGSTVFAGAELLCVLLLAGPDQHACAVFRSNMMDGLVLLVVVNRGRL